MVLAGKLRERVGASDEIARPLSIVVKPRDTEHANDFGDGVRTLQIMLPSEAAADAESWESVLRHWRWQHGGAAVPRFMELLCAVRSSPDDPGRAGRVERAAYDALGALGELARPSSSEAPHWLSLVRERLDDADRPPLVRALAAGAGVHPVYLARQFRRWYGCSITEHVKRRRVQRAAAAMTTASTPLSLVAYEAGYADQAHMCRVFARETGVTPSRFRKLAGS